MKISELNGKKILILGYGVEGKATHEFLLKYVKAKEIGVADRKLNGGDYLKKQNDYDIAIKSPGIHKSKITIPYTTATNIFFANVKGKTIGVTGSKGKSTTSALIYTILSQAGKRVHLVGNITHKLNSLGQPLLAGLLDSNVTNDIWICELSSFMLDDIQYSPNIAVITSFFPEHVDFHKSVKEYWEAKQKIVKFSNDNDYFVYNQKFPELTKLARNVKAQVIPYMETPHFPEKIIPLTGKHNIDNVKAAVTVSRILNIPLETIRKAVESFTPLPHRLENIGTFNGITFYNDAISTTPESTIEAIRTLKNISTIFLGGQDRGYDFANLIELIIKNKIPNIVFFPDSGKTMLNLLKLKIKNQLNILETSSMDEAVKFAYKYTPKDSICLLSTASPSYSVWENFEVKGKSFNEAVKKYSRAYKVSSI